MKNLNPDYEIVGMSPSIKEVRQRIEEFAPLDDPVLVTGETGTGKEIVARQIHRKSKRAKESFHVVNCSCIPKDIAESELFGHEKGTFTGAQSPKQGMFELADHGTLFLDEVESTPTDIQPKFLRVLVDGVVRHLGGHREIHTDVRVIAATNKELRGDPDFRQDLYYRLDGTRIDILPLRERREDIELIALFYLNQLNSFYRTKKYLDPEAFRRLRDYNFPGNVWELENILRHAFVRSHTEKIEYHLIEEKTSEKTASNFVPRTDASFSSIDTDSTITLKELKKQDIEKALVAALMRHGGKKSAAARQLGIANRSIYYLIERTLGYDSVNKFYEVHGIPMHDKDVTNTEISIGSRAEKKGTRKQITEKELAYALRRTDGYVAGTAQQLGICDQTIYNKIRSFGYRTPAKFYKAHEIPQPHRGRRGLMQ